MKIVFNTDQVHLHGGIEKVIATKANYFAGLPGYEVVILTTEQQGNKPCYPLEARIQYRDLQVDYDRSQSYFSLTNLKKAFAHFFRQKKCLKALQPDIIISANFNFDHYWLPFIKSSKTKVIKEIHSSGYTTPELRKNANFVEKLKWQFNDWIMAKYDRIVVLNADEKCYQMTTNVTVIPNPIEISGEQAVLNSKKVLAAGRIAAVKGFDQLIAAWEIVHQKHPDWQLHIFGDDYANTTFILQEEIKNLQLDEVVFFKDSVSNIPKTMLDYSIYAMSSVTECFPMVLLEAMSIGLPIVAYDCPNGPRHIISNEKDGILVANQNPKALAEGLLLLIENETLRKNMGKNAKINSSNFETTLIMQKWLDLFQ